jgi:hypothetical protein
MWRLAWCSPYKPGDITPGYDVRIIEGQARLGARGGMIARARDPKLGTPGLLDLQATVLHALISEPTAVAWLEVGTRFTLANARAEVKGGIFIPTMTYLLILRQKQSPKEKRKNSSCSGVQPNP